MTSTPPVLDQLRDDLVAGIHTFERRRSRTRRVLGSGAVVVLGVAVATAVVASGDDPGERVTSTPNTAVGSTATTSAVRPEPISGSGVTALLFATNGNGRDLSVIDLRAGVRAVYDEEEHQHGNGAISGAVFTADERLVVWQTGRRALVYPAARLAGGSNPLVARGALSGPGREIGTIVGERQIVPTDAGDRVWIRASAGTGGDAESTLELVDLETGSVQLTTMVPSGLLPAGAGLLEAVGDDATVVVGRGGPDEQVLRFSPSGRTSVIEPPEPAIFLMATPAHTVWAASGNRLLIVNANGSVTTVAAPDAGEWALTGSPTIPSNSPDFRTVTADGSRALFTLNHPNDLTYPSSRLVLVDLVAGTATALSHSDGTPFTPITAFWAQDDRTIVAIDGPNDRQTASTLDTDTGATMTVADAIPEGFFVVAAR